MKKELFFAYLAASGSFALAQQLIDAIDPYSITGYTFAEQVAKYGRHLGEDANPTIGVGTPVRAIADGVVFLSKTKRPGYGQYVVISHSSPIPFVSVYGHLSRQAQYPLRGLGNINQGDIVGYVGSSEENGGWAPHLHIGIFTKAPDGKYHYWGYAPNSSGDDVDLDALGNIVGGFFTKPSQFISQYHTVPTMGTVIVNATLDGNPTTSPTFTLADPNSHPVTATLGKAIPGLSSGIYSLSFTGGTPANASLAGIGPCVVLTLGATCAALLPPGQSLTFTLQFTSNPPTAGFTMSSGNQSATDGQTLNLTAPAGSPPTVSFSSTTRSTAFNGNTIKDWTWTANGSLLATTNQFPATFPVGTSTTISLVVTDSRGVSSTAATGAVIVTQQGPSGFSPTASMNEVRVYHTATLLNDGTVLVTGGGFGSPSSNTAEIYIPSSGTWHYTAYPMNSGRTTHMAVKLNDGRVLIAGGYNEGLLNNCEIYDPTTGKFTVTGSMNAVHSVLPMVLLNDGRVMVVEGNIASYGSATPPSEIYDPTSGTWSIVPSPAVGISLLAAVTLNNGNVLAITGYDGCCALNANVRLFNPATNTLSSMMPLIVGRFAETATTLLDGRVLVVAGTDWTQTINSTEIYDMSVLPNGGSQLGSPLNAARRAHTATLLPNGDVLVVAGYQAPNSQPVTAYLSSAELWSHTTGVWSLAGSLLAGVYAHTATLLPSGAVLVTGGANPAQVNTASIWNP